MQVIVNKKKVTLENTDMFGAEGEIFLLSYQRQKKCVKIYDPNKRTPYQEKKVLSLIQRFNQFHLGGIEEQVAYPELPVYDAKTKQFCGFVMKYFSGYEQISKYCYNLGALSFRESSRGDDYFLTVIDDIYTYIEVLNRAGIVLGDLNPQNILISKDSKPALVDIDSAQIGTFHSNSQRREYKDPKVQMDGFGNNKFFVYSTDSDIFSLSIIAYELMIGSNPYFFQTIPPTESYYKKEQGVCLLDYVFDNEKKTKKMDSLKLLKNDFYYASLDRLTHVQESHPKLLQYFMDIFIHGHRKYLYLDEKREKPKISSKKYEHIDGIEYVMGYSKEDPEELTYFIDQYNLNL